MCFLCAVVCSLLAPKAFTTHEVFVDASYAPDSELAMRMGHWARWSLLPMGGLCSVEDSRSWAVVPRQVTHWLEISLLGLDTVRGAKLNGMASTAGLLKLC